jgi:hypothetical protein
MPKRPSRSKSRARRVRRPKRASKIRRMPARIRAVADDEAQIDGCDVELSESHATPDMELPKARGGVETVRRRVR